MKLPTRSRRKAISPVLATVILIAITLIAAIAVAGFVFGLFGSFTSSATVSASVVNCTWAANVATCTLSLDNTGTANTSTSGTCSLTYGGVTYQGTTTAAVLTAGKTAANACVTTAAAAAPDPGAGTRIVGSLTTTNGASIPYSGTASS